MALKRKIKQSEFDGLDTAIQQLYVEVEGDDGIYVLDAESDEDTAALKSAFERVKAENKAAKAKMKELEATGTERDNLQALVDKAGGAEQLAKFAKLQEESEHNELLKLATEGGIQQVIDRVTQRAKADHQTELAALKKQIEERDQKLGDLGKSLSSAIIDSGIKQAAMEHVVSPSAAELMVRVGRETWQLDENNRPVARADGELQFGKDGKPLQFGEWVESLKETHPFLFKGQSGTGTSPSNPHLPLGQRGTHQITREEMADLSKVARAKEAAKAAGLPNYEIIESA